jgi:hypothetical protein
MSTTAPRYTRLRLGVLEKPVGPDRHSPLGAALCHAVVAVQHPTGPMTRTLNGGWADRGSVAALDQE